MNLTPEHQAILNWHEVARESLADAPEAYTWLSQVQDFAWGVDHVIDGDKLDKSAFNTSVKQVLLEWPANPFFQANRAGLVPAMAACLNAWERSDECPEERMLAYNPATELAVTVLFLVGGRERVDEYGLRLRELAARIRKHNDEAKQCQHQ